MIKFMVLAILGFSMASVSFASSVRTSSMNEDIVISLTLFNALTASVGSVQNVAHDGSKISLTVDSDQLSCDQSGCVLSWDTSSPTYQAAASAFESALFDVLENWANGSGATDMAIHKTVLAPSGNTQITVSGAPGSSDFVECSLLNLAGSIAEKSCSLVVSDYSTGTDAALQKQFSQMLAGQALVGAEIQTLLNSFKSSLFLSPGDPKNGNGVIQSLRTLNTGLLYDGIVLTAYYGYVTPVLNSAGQLVSDGIALTLSGSQNGPDSYIVDQVGTESYSLSVAIP